MSISGYAILAIPNVVSLFTNEEPQAAENLPPEILRCGREAVSTPPGSDADLETISRFHIADTFHRHQGNKTRTARALGISRRTLYRLLEKHSIEFDIDADGANS